MSERESISNQIRYLAQFSIQKSIPRQSDFGRLYDDEKFLAELRRSEKYDYKPYIDLKKLTHSQKLILISERMFSNSDDPLDIVKAKIIHYLVGTDIDSTSVEEFHEQITADIELLNLPVKIT